MKLAVLIEIPVQKASVLGVFGGLCPGSIHIHIHLHIHIHTYTLYANIDTRRSLEKGRKKRRKKMNGMEGAGGGF